jgi:hypothetical protein
MPELSASVAGNLCFLWGKNLIYVLNPVIFRDNFYYQYVIDDSSAAITPNIPR